MSENERMAERELLALAVSRNTSAEKLSELAKENSWDVRKLVAVCLHKGLEKERQR